MICVEYKSLLTDTLTWYIPLGRFVTGISLRSSISVFSVCTSSILVPRALKSVIIVFPEDSLVSFKTKPTDAGFGQVVIELRPLTGTDSDEFLHPFRSTAWTKYDPDFFPDL